MARWRLRRALRKLLSITCYITYLPARGRKVQFRRPFLMGRRWRMRAPRVGCSREQGPGGVCREVGCALSACARARPCQGVHAAIAKERLPDGRYLVLAATGAHPEIGVGSSRRFVSPGRHSPLRERGKEERLSGNRTPSFPNDRRAFDGRAQQDPADSRQSPGSPVSFPAASRRAP